MEMNSTIQERIASEIILPCGERIKNRFVKSAMSEGLGTKENAPTKGLARLYRKFAEGGTGLVITGNVMIDSRALGEPRNVVMEDESHMDILKKWANEGTENGTHLWVQLNHPGKQIPSFLSKEPLAPSDVPLSDKISAFFNPPRALREDEIENIIDRFANSAKIAKKAGFTGVQIHGAHGYLVSEFLSPHHNRRTDAWGGSPEKRMKFVMEVYKRIRETVGKDFPVGIKLNSADFQKGGFSNEESLDVISHLANAGIDLIEISGGTYENPAMTGNYIRESTKKREAYFIEFAEQVRKRINTPLVVTGGFRSSEGMIEAIDGDAVDMVGLARPIAVDPDLPSKILNGEKYRSSVKPLTTGIKALDKVSMLEISWYEQQLARMAKGRAPNPNQSTFYSVAKSMFDNGYHAFQRRRAKE